MGPTTLFLNNIYNNKKLLLLFIFLISVFVSSIFLILFKNVGPSQHFIPGTDYLTFYEPVADNLLQGKGFFFEEGLRIKYPIGYPLILAIIFGLSALLGIGKISLVIVFNVIMTAGAVCFLFLIAKSVFNKRIALIASFLWLCYPLNLWFLKNPNSEVPFILFLYAGLWLYILALNKKHFGFIFLSGAILGFAALIRPIGLLLPLFLSLLIFFLLREYPKKLCFLLALVLLIGGFVAIFPWELYVFSSIGQVIPLSTIGPASAVDGLTFALKDGDGGNRVVVSQDVFALMERAENGNLSTGVKVFQFCAQELTSRPTTFLKLMGMKIIRSWYATSQMWWEGKILLLQLFYLIPGLFGIIYGFKKHKDKIRNMIFLLVAIFYFWLMTFSALSILRYMIPAMGLVIIFSAIGVSVLMDKLKFFQNSNSKL